MKTFPQILSKVIIVMLIAMIPMVSIGQGQTQTKKEEKKEAPKVKQNAAPTHNYWGVTVFGGLAQFNGDLSKNLLLNISPAGDYLGWTAGLSINKQFTRVIGLRLRFAYDQLKSQVDGKFNITDGTPAYLHKSYSGHVVETDLDVTINWLNWILGYKPERLFSSYLVAGAGYDATTSSRKDLLLPNDQQNNINNGAFKVIAGIGFDFNINKHWSINPEILWRWQGSDKMDLTGGGVMEVKNDMYSSVQIGLTYKFAYRGCSIKKMMDNADLIKYEATPNPMVSKGDSVTVTIKGTVPPNYFCPTAAMLFQPQIKYQGGTYDLKPIQLIGEKVTGPGTMIKYKEGGTFGYTTTFPYKPEMAVSELTVAPIVYDAKTKTYPKKDDIKANVKYVEFSSKSIANGIIYTDKRILNDFLSIRGQDKYVPEVIQAKMGTIFFKKNKYDLDLKYGINKTKEAQDMLAQLNDFIKTGWKIKDISIDGYASPEGEEILNTGLSENRSKTGDTYMIDQFKKWVAEKQKDNKDKKAVKAMLETAGKDVNIVLQHHGPDWNGFMKNVQGSNVKDKDKILNVINSSGDEKKKEEEIRKMVYVYPELEKDLLPPLRRAEIAAHMYEQKLTKEELVKASMDKPETVALEDILYAETLVQKAGEPVPSNDEILISENAAKVFPNDWRTLNNAAVVNIKKGNLDKASNYLQKAAAVAPNNGTIENNIGVVAGKNNDYKKAEAQFKKAQQLGENENYNLGVLAIQKGDYQKANNLLANAKCTYNLGLAQLVSGNTSAAQTTLACAPQTPENFYLLAICGARTNNTKMLYDNLLKAVADPKLKEQAKTDREFYNYFNTPDFKNIVK